MKLSTYSLLVFLASVSQFAGAATYQCEIWTGNETADATFSYDTAGMEEMAMGTGGDFTGLIQRQQDGSLVVATIANETGTVGYTVAPSGTPDINAGLSLPSGQGGATACYTGSLRASKRPMPLSLKTPFKK